MGEADTEREVESEQPNDTPDEPTAPDKRSGPGGRRAAGGRSRRKPKTWKWRAEWLVQVGLERLTGCFSPVSVFKLGERLGGLAWHLMRARRKVVMRNLRIAFAGEKSLEELHGLARAVFRRSGANLLSAGRTARMTPEEILEVITVENPEVIEAAVSSGKGAVILPPHMGNWEVLSRLNSLVPAGREIGAFYRPLNNPLLNERVVTQRKIDGTHLFSKRDSFHQVTRFLRDGGLVGLLADQRVGFQGEVVSFFGRLTRASPLPGLLARRAKCEVLAMSLRTVSPGKWAARFHPVEKPYTTANCMEAIERAMRQSAVDVFWFQERWKVFVGRKRRVFADWLGDPGAVSRKPHRGLIWLADAPAAWRVPADWFHQDLVYEAVLPAGAGLPSWLPEATRVHRLPEPAGEKALAGFIGRIDGQEVLPIDFVLAACGGGWVSAAHREGLPVIFLDDGEQ